MNNIKTPRVKKEIAPILEKEICVKNKDYKVFLSYIGEGYCGDYNEDDPEDEPLLRIDIQTKCCDDRRSWDTEGQYSTCTSISARISEEDAEKICQKVLNNLVKIPEGKVNEWTMGKAWSEAY